MEITFSQLARLVSFVNKIEGETYPEAPSFIHSEITGKVLDTLLPQYLIDHGARILDIGCGQGPALNIFRDKGYRSVVGITLNDEDVRICRENGCVRWINRFSNFRMIHLISFGPDMLSSTAFFHISR